MKLVGYPISPFVRKVQVGLEMKGLDYEIDPLNPYLEKDRLRPINPNGTVPVLVNEKEVLPESSDILHWLDKHYPGNPIYPATNRKKAEELEMGADYQMVSVFGGNLFFQRVILPFYFKREGRDEYVQAALSEGAPAILKQLNDVVPHEGYLAGEFSAADIALSSWIRAGLLSGVEIDAGQLPSLHGYLRRVYAQPAYAKVIQSENHSEVIQWAIKTWQLDDELIGFEQ